MADRQDVNTEQAEAWNGDEGTYWVKQLERHEAMYRRLTPRLLEAARITGDARVLDIGCGCGGTTRAAARTAVQGTALGVDLSRPMLEAARRLAVGDGLDRVRFEQGDAQIRPFPPAGFDVALSRFGVMFFEDPQAAFVNIARALRPGGRLAFLCWRSVAENEFLAVPFGALAQYVPLPDLGRPGDPGPFSLADPQRVRELLTGAGFGDVRVEPVDEPMWMGADVDDVVAYQLGTPAARSMLAAANEAGGETVERALDALRRALAHHQGQGGVELGGAAWLVTAERLASDVCLTTTQR
ncbi:class I SAM-dependent methyltransferase [Streptomyces sp. NPDC054783]